MLYNERIKKFFCIKCGWNLTTEDQEKLKSKTDDGNNRGSADKPMKRGGKTDNSSAAEVVKDIFAVSKDTRANERKKKDQFDYLRKDDGTYLQKPGVSLIRGGYSFQKTEARFHLWN
jgi:hypothetical protein